jgi:hypothetical protein
MFVGWKFLATDFGIKTERPEANAISFDPKQKVQSHEVKLYVQHAFFFRDIFKDGLSCIALPPFTNECLRFALLFGGSHTLPAKK